MTTISTTTSPSAKGMGLGRIYNFSAGPAMLPERVLAQAQKDLWNLDGSGIGILEHSHRGKTFNRVIEEAESDIRALAKISDDYHVLFLQGGATTQFFMIPMNFATQGDTLDYIDTGSWAVKAIKDARRFANVNIVASSKSSAYDRIPDCTDCSFSDGAVYCHFTSNNTIAGTQFRTEPEHPGDAFLVCDASSDIFCRPIDVSKYGIIYAGAQKNLGPSGTVLVIIRKDIAERSGADLPDMLRYQVHAEKGSRFNTPPTFGIYTIGQIAKWIRDEGGLEAMGKRNGSSAALLYDFLDQSALFSAHAQTDSRSLMNVTFRTGAEETDKQFIAEATKRGFDGLEGHRSVGGMRASIYNAFPEQGVRDLVALMREFESRGC